MKGVQVVALAKEHIDDLLAIEAESNSSPWSRSSFEQEIDHAPSVFIVAKRGGTVAGFAGAWVVADECHITTIAVSQAFRRQGLGRMMVRDLLSRAKSKGAACATLEVRASNSSAIALYEGFGFKGAGVRKAYYPDNNEDAVIMWRNDLEGIA